ncbi:leucine-rich repeat domain-containing protein [Butyrivibrio sp. INlla16]|uniref:leucine-rich repeat domain-containing protein n=1 Tax=Butyrivibrio sp. INlla16 TaxID=1520807 RepID=UPI0008845C46|nr:leucine-rich repeat domain-containing protein [Butyrivibrio sp. INlla16]SDB42633.1 Leucine rich repeat-containing protein [Butyrivibrio sp. INlla16]
MKEATSNKKAIKRIVSSVMALAVALCMCMVAMPMRVLAVGEAFMIDNTGNVNGATADIGSGQLKEGTRAEHIEYDLSTSTLTIKNAQFSDFGFSVSGQTIKVIGDNSTDYLGITDVPLTIELTAGSNLTIGSFRIAGTEISLGDAQQQNKIIIKGGKIEGGKIVATEPTEEKVDDGIKVGDEVQEPDKTPKESPTYKVVSTDEDNRSVTYEKPAENASGTETVKATVTLADKKEYKVTGIGEGAFANFGGKDNITGIVISDSVEEIGAGACKDCKNLESVKIGSGVKKIGANAFAGCAALTTADLTDNVEEIGASAFSDCAKLKSLTIGKKVKKIGAKAYYNCSGLKNIKVKSTYLTKKSKVGKKAFFKINKKAKVKVKMSKGDAKKFKVKTIKVFKNKSIGYVKTWKVS